MRLETHRFILREFSMGDGITFEAYRADPRFLTGAQAMELGPVRSMELLHLFMKWAGEQPRRHYQLAIVPRSEARRVIGCCGLRNFDVRAGEAELGIELAREYWGQHRCAVEVVEALLRYGFDSFGLQEIYGNSIGTNTRVGRLANWFGAGVNRISVRDEMTDVTWTRLEWRLTRSQWDSSGGRVGPVEIPRRHDTPRSPYVVRHDE